MPTPLYLLDTNIVVHYVRGDAIWENIRTQYQLLLLEPTPLISIVTIGEIRSLAHQFRWGQSKLERMEFILGFFDIVPIVSDEIATEYAMLDAYSQSLGHRVGKNDLWIAATCVVADARLLTMDSDFDDFVPAFFERDLILPII